MLDISISITIVLKKNIFSTLKNISNLLILDVAFNKYLTNMVFLKNRESIKYEFYMIYHI